MLDGLDALAWNISDINQSNRFPDRIDRLILSGRTIHGRRDIAFPRIVAYRHHTKTITDRALCLPLSPGELKAKVFGHYNEAV